MRLQFVKLGLICSLLASGLSVCKAQNNEPPPRIMNVCINDLAVTNNPLFLENIDYTLKSTRYDSEDLDQVDAVIYYNSDSLDVVFQEYKGLPVLVRIDIKCKSCVYDCEGINLISLGDSVDKLKEIDENKFEEYAMTYYSDISNREGIDGIPDMIIPFSFQFPRMPDSQAGQINVSLKDKIVSQILILFYRD